MTKRTRPQGPPQHDEAEHVAAEIVPRGAAPTANPTPHARVRRFRAVRDVVAEINLLYGLARRGKLAWGDYAKACYGLNIAGNMLTATEVEARLERLEGKGTAS